PFSDWLENKMELPIFDELPAGLDQRNYVPVDNIKPVTMPLVMAVPSVISPSLEIKSPLNQPIQDTQTLIREFEALYDNYEITNGTLTPPQSPPAPVYTTIIPEDPKELITLQQMVPVQPIIQSIPIMKNTPIIPLVPVIYAGERKESLLSLEQMVPETPSPDVAHELQVVEELVRTRAEDLVDISSNPCTPTWESYSSSSSAGVSPGRESEGEMYHVSPPSPCTSSSSSSYGSGEETCDDPEWNPSVEMPAPSSLKAGRKRNGTKPYSRPGIEEKRMRKKEQNKNAATRYRQKKKAEIEEILHEEKGLEDKNSELKVKVNDLSREIKYLKGLMRDLFKAKGLLK
ncbi:hypothetical protein L9F63_015628, partial [Diploptera punctata]